ncbi:MAG: response regulator [Bacteriovoracaceae bacterium]|nr:response regulator [Bacteroidota bacterium]
MDNIINILHLEDNVTDHELLYELLKENGLNVRIDRTETKENFLERVRSFPYDLVISDFSLPAYDGKSALSDLRKENLDVPFIFVSGNIGEEFAVESLKHGATDYILKNNLKRLPSAVLRAMSEWKAKRLQYTIENELRDREQFIQKVTDTTPNIIYVYDLKNDHIVWINNSVKTILGYDPMTIRNTKQAAKHYFHPEDHEKFNAIETWRTPSHGGEIVDYSFRMKNTLGKWRWFHSRATIFSVDSNKIPEQILGIAEDITEKLELEAQLYRSQRIESIGTLAGGIAHDLNNVFGPMLLAIPMLRRQMPDENSKKFLSLIENGIHRGSNMVKQILMFAKGSQIESEVLSPKLIIDEIENIMRQTFPKAIEIRVVYDKGVSHVVGDRTQLHQVLLNLCVNARDAMPNGGILTLSCTMTQLQHPKQVRTQNINAGSYIEISVKDTGTGISEEILGKVFDPYFTTKEVGKGTGIGLPTVQSIVHNHHGLVDVSSTVGSGTTFTVYLPAKSSALQNVPIINSPLPLGQGECILVIDDESSMLQAAKAALESSHYKTITARDGAEAVAVFAMHAKEIDMVICDMNMPLMDGSKTVPVLKTLQPSIKIVIASGSPEMAAEEKLMEVYGVVLMPKPYTVEKLLVTVNTVLKSR